MIDRIELNRLVREVVRASTGMRGDEVRPANQTAAVKGDSFATVFIVSAIPPEQPSNHDWTNIDGPEKELTERVENHVTVIASCQFFRKDALRLAQRLRDRIVMSPVLSLMQSYGLGYISSSAVKDLSSVINQDWEERAQVELTFHYVSKEDVVVPSFGTFPIDSRTEVIQSTNEVHEP